LNSLLIDAYASNVGEWSITGHAQALAALGRNRRIQATALQIAAHAHLGDTDDLLDRLQTLRTPSLARLKFTSADDVTLDRPHWI
ncbi:hypothetical protein, partial [Burkholderia cepacia]|uniref:hypothetical protein n=1 Tax=Burkholderia cepacia TaxID=292 RepID=UPI001591182F